MNFEITDGAIETPRSTGPNGRQAIHLANGYVLTIGTKHQHVRNNESIDKSTKPIKFLGLFQPNQQGDYIRGV